MAGEDLLRGRLGSLLDGYTFIASDALGILPYSLSLSAAGGPA